MTLKISSGRFSAGTNQSSSSLEPPQVTLAKQTRPTTCRDLICLRQNFRQKKIFMDGHRLNI